MHFCSSPITIFFLVRGVRSWAISKKKIMQSKSAEIKIEVMLFLYMKAMFFILKKLFAHAITHQKNMRNLKVRKKIRAPEHSSLISVVVVKHCQFYSFDDKLDGSS